MITDHVQPDRRIDDVSIFFASSLTQSAGSTLPLDHQPIIRPSAARVPIFNTLGCSPNWSLGFRNLCPNP